MDWQRYTTGFQKWSDAEGQSHFFFKIYIPDDHSASSHPFPAIETSNIIHKAFDVCGWTQHLSELRTEFSTPARPGDTLIVTACSVESSEDRIRVALAISNKQGYSIARAEAIFEVLPQAHSTSPLREDCFLYDTEQDERLERADGDMYDMERDESLEWSDGHSWLD